MKYGLFLLFLGIFHFSVIGQTDGLWQYQGLGFQTPGELWVQSAENESFEAKGEQVVLTMLTIEEEAWENSWSIKDYLNAVEGRGSKVQEIDLADYDSAYRIVKGKEGKTWLQLLHIPNSNNRYLVMMDYKKCKGKREAKAISKSFYFVD